jgi:hypothetical protein
MRIMTRVFDSFSDWQPFRGTVIEGHRVASGLGGDTRFPGGTLRMQWPHFLAQGLDLRGFHPGTVNVCIAPYSYRVHTPRATYRAVKWHPVAPAEDFSFFDIRVRTDGGEVVNGLVYRPHPETKPEHFQATDVLELLLPWVPSVRYGAVLELATPADQVAIGLPDRQTRSGELGS